jgi:hypothetical protein
VLGAASIGPLYGMFAGAVTWRIGRAARGQFTLTVDGVPVLVTVAIQTTQFGQRGVLRLAEQTVSREKAEAIFKFVAHGRQAETGLRHVQQRRGSCAVAAAAIIGGVSYEVAAACLPDQAAGRPRDSAQPVALLERVTHGRWRHFRLPGQGFPLNRILFPDHPVAVVIWQPVWFFRRHTTSRCIVVKGPAVHDPNLWHAVRLDEYSRRNWNVLEIYEA